MDKLRRVLSGQEDNEERGLTDQVGGVWQLRDKALMLTFLERAPNTDISLCLFQFLAIQHSPILLANKMIYIISSFVLCI